MTPIMGLYREALKERALLNRALVGPTNHERGDDASSPLLAVHRNISDCGPKSEGCTRTLLAALAVSCPRWV